jgi:PEP-CTERM motif
VQEETHPGSDRSCCDRCTANRCCPRHSHHVHLYRRGLRHSQWSSLRRHRVTFVFTADTTDIDTSGAPFFDLHDVAGTFTEGSYSATLAPTVTIVATEDVSFPRINFFNADVTNGLGLNNSALATYDLSTSIGPITTPPGFLTPTFPGVNDPPSSGFATLGDGAVIFTADDSLVFTAALQTPPPAVPEPSTIVLMTAGVLGMGLIYWRSRRQGAAFGMNSIG